MHAGQKLSYLVALVMAGLASFLTSRSLEGREWLTPNADLAEARWIQSPALALEIQQACSPVIRADLALAANADLLSSITAFTNENR